MGTKVWYLSQDFSNILGGWQEGSPLFVCFFYSTSSSSQVGDSQPQTRRRDMGWLGVASSAGLLKMLLFHWPSAPTAGTT
jgi:hypothetical protein